jgi:hypothetical protein
MAFGSQVRTTLGMDIGPFRRGLVAASQGIVNFKKQASMAGAGSFGGLIGISGLVMGFRAVVAHARRARDEAEALGQTIDKNTAATAQLGDNFERISTNVAGLAGRGLGAITRFVNGIGQAMGTASSLEEIDALRRAEQGAAANDAQLAARKAASERERQTLTEKIQSARAALISSTLTDEEKLAEVYAQQLETHTKLKAMSERGQQNTTAALRLQTQLIAQTREVFRLQQATAAPALDRQSTEEIAAFGGRSSQARFARQSIAMRERAARAQASGNMSLAGTLTQRANFLAERAGAGQPANDQTRLLTEQAAYLKNISQALTPGSIN